LPRSDPLLAEFSQGLVDGFSHGLVDAPLKVGK
jgi:hypothetical protein